MLLTLLSNAMALLMLWLFIQAALHKLLPANRSYFTDLLEQQFSLAPKAGVILTGFIGIMELILALAIIYPDTRPIASVLVALILIMYAANMVVQMYLGKKDMECGCAGPGREIKISVSLVVRNLILAALALFCLSPIQDIGWSMGLLSLQLAVVAVLVNQSAELLLENSQKLALLRL